MRIRVIAEHDSLSESFRLLVTRIAGGLLFRMIPFFGTRKTESYETG